MELFEGFTRFVTFFAADEDVPARLDLIRNMKLTPMGEPRLIQPQVATEPMGYQTWAVQIDGEGPADQAVVFYRVPRGEAPSLVVRTGVIIKSHAFDKVELWASRDGIVAAKNLEGEITEIGGVNWPRVGAWVGQWPEHRPADANEEIAFNAAWNVARAHEPPVESVMIPPHVYDFVEIVATAARRQPENELLRNWLQGPQYGPYNLHSTRVIQLITNEYPCGSTKLRTLMICAQQDLTRIPFDSARSWDFFLGTYERWHATQTPSSLESVADAETLLGFLQERLPEAQLQELAEKFPTAQSVLELCDAHGIQHRFTPTSGPYLNYSTFRSLLNQEMTGFDLWTEIYHRSVNGWCIRFQDLVDAAGFSPANAS